MKRHSAARFLASPIDRVRRHGVTVGQPKPVFRLGQAIVIETTVECSPSAKEVIAPPDGRSRRRFDLLHEAGGEQFASELLRRGDFQVRCGNETAVPRRGFRSDL